MLQAALERRDRLRTIVPRIVGFGLVESISTSSAVHLGAAAALTCRRRLCSELIRRCIRPYRFYRLTQMLRSSSSLETMLAEDVPALTSTAWRLTVDQIRALANVCVFGRSIYVMLCTRDGLPLPSAESFRLTITAALAFVSLSYLSRFSRSERPPRLKATLHAGHSKLRREAEAVAFARTHGQRWLEIETAWKAELAEQRLQKWQTSIVKGLRHAVVKGISAALMLTLSRFYQRSHCSEMTVGAAVCHLRMLWASSSSMSAAVSMMQFDLRDKWYELLKPGVRVWRLIEALEIVEREDLPDVGDSNDGIVLQDADIWDMDGTRPVAIRLSVVLPPGKDGLLLCGRQGVGKGTVARTLCGLLPAEVGTVSVPPPQDIQFLPPRPYLPAGTLTDQVTYPDPFVLPVSVEVEARFWVAVRGACLEDDMQTAELDRWSERWSEILSLSIQQRLAFARFLWHTPRFAVLEEGCTSAINPDMELDLLGACKRASVTIVQVSQRPSHHLCHARVLYLEGGGRWTLESKGKRHP